jgi:hypothetical protein
MKKIILSLVVLSAVFVSCKKDDKNCDLNAGNVTGSYKITGLTYKANTATPVVDEYALFPACQKDDLIIFNANGTTTYSDAGVVCTPPGNDTGIWTLSGNSISLDGDVYVVAAFSCTGMTLTQAGPDPGELTTITVAKQ